ncbi:hypothetical protein HYU13_03885, partial [Candidatus Woesearchaeota archaeon]|nr:hypothetical protein [Candidatus Woesearchaeota archaeon]
CSERNGKVVAIRAVEDSDELMFISKNGITIRTPASGISIIGRNTQGMRMMRLEEGDKVVAAAKIAGEGRIIGEGKGAGEGRIIGEGKGAGEGRIIGEGKGAGEGRIIGEGKIAGEEKPVGEQDIVEEEKIPDGEKIVDEKKAAGRKDGIETEKEIKHPGNQDENIEEHDQNENIKEPNSSD